MLAKPLLQPKLLAFDLDGTLLNSKKELTVPTIRILQKSVSNGIKIVFASGRIKSSIDQYTRLCPFPVSVLSLNGAAVYSDQPSGQKRIYSASLPHEYSDFLIDYSRKNKTLLNFYHEDTLFAIKNEDNLPWLALYIEQTRSMYTYLDSFQSMTGVSPSKIIFVGQPEVLDRQQHYFTEKWGNTVYICRTWDYYLEFLNPLANKAAGLSALADYYNISSECVVSFGDAENDIPMLQYSGFSVAVQNAGEPVKKAAKKVSCWTNDQEAIEKELNLIFQNHFKSYSNH